YALAIATAARDLLLRTELRAERLESLRNVVPEASLHFRIEAVVDAQLLQDSSQEPLHLPLIVGRRSPQELDTHLCELAITPSLRAFVPIAARDVKKPQRPSRGLRPSQMPFFLHDAGDLRYQADRA